MLTYPNIDPVAISLGPLKIHWYGLCYLMAFALAFFLGRKRAGRTPWESWSAKQVEDFIFWSVLGVLIGGRLGYVLFYQLPFYLANPLAVFQIWQGGMSFHGGLIGVIITLALWSRKHKRGFLETTDFCAPLTPLGLAMGRLGNFINGELVGRPTDLPWGMVFRHVDSLPRHPSQLYEFSLEGLLLFALMWWFSATRRPTGMISGAFLALYGVIRFCVEFTREPDTQLGFLAGGITMGQWLSLPMMIIGIGMMVWAERRHIQ